MVVLFGGMVVLFGGMVVLFGWYGCVIWGYSLHYRVWLSFGGMVILFWVIVRPGLGLGQHG